MGKLTAAQVKGLRMEGRYLDGQGLALVVREGGRRYWTYRYQRGGRERLMSFGNADHISLARARELHAQARAIVLAGGDPLTERAQAQAPQGEHRFAEVAEDYIRSHEAGWRGKRSAETWRQTLTDHVFPKLGKLPTAEIDTTAVLTVLTPIWNRMPETASRIRGRIEIILDYAAVRGWRSGPNPAIWRGNLKLTLPARAKVRPVEHHPAMPWQDMPAFMARLRALTTVHAAALQFIILTASRSGEVRGARWDEFDLERRVWTVPGVRMKAGKPHRVPLSDAAMAVLHRMAGIRTGELVFFGRKPGRPLPDTTLLRVLWALGHRGTTVHGCRSSFRDWAAEATAYPNHVVEQALAHSIGSAVEAAYRRGDLFAKRVALMSDYAAYLASAPAQVVPLRPAAAR
jgi:integrase